MDPYFLDLGSRWEWPFTGPEPACGISIGAAKGAVGNWLSKKHIKHWDSDRQRRLYQDPLPKEQGTC
jgi:hypothetical protein